MASAPGRVCFAGEDIDWISGPSVLCAIDLRTNVVVRKNTDLYTLKTEGSQNSELNLTKEKIGIYSHKILDYTNAAIKVLEKNGVKITPLSVEITSNLPAKAGLSSSAAVSIASIAAISSFYGLDLSVNTVCDLAYKVESSELKTGAGQMDMYSCGLGGLIYLDSSTIPPKEMGSILCYRMGSIW